MRPTLKRCRHSHRAGSLRENTPRSSHYFSNWVAKRRSIGKRTAGSISAHRSSRSYDSDACNEWVEGNYTLGQGYGGEAKRHLKPYGTGAISGRGRGGGRNVQIPGRHLRSHWMQALRGCFVCGKEQRDNHHHSRDEVTEAI